MWYWTKKNTHLCGGQGWRQSRPAASFVVSLDRRELKVLRRSSREYWRPGRAVAGHANYLLREGIRQRFDQMEDEGRSVAHLPRLKQI